MAFRHSEHLEGQGDLVSRFITPITHIVIPFIPVINLLTKSPLTSQTAVTYRTSLQRITLIASRPSVGSKVAE